MSTFTCQTCALVSPDIGKHLSSTRHKTVTYDALQETVECEECGDSNIHILQMLRFGLSDLSLLCAPCSSKTETQATAEYSLANGSIVSKLPQYYKFRDIQCGSCGKDKKLAVSNTGKSQIIKCSDCISKEGSSSSKFVSEDSEDFLFALLGIKEYIAKPGAKSKSGPRKTGRMGGRMRKPKPQDADAERRKAHYENAKATRLSFKSEKTVKAVGSSASSPRISRNVSPSPTTFSAKKQASSKPVKGSNVPKGDLKGASKSTSSTKGQAKDKKKSSSSQVMPQEGKPENMTSKISKDRSGTPVDGALNSKAANKTKSQGSEPSKPPSKSKSADSKKQQKSTLEESASESKKDALPTSKASSKKKGRQEKVALDEEARVQPNASKPITEKKESKKAAESSQNRSKKNGKSESAQNSTSEKNAAPAISSDKTRKNTKGLSKTSSKTPEEQSAKKSDTDLIKLPPGIFKHIPSPTPKLTYDSMEEYFNEMCYNLFLEEKMSIHTSQKVLLTAEDFELEWYADQDKKHKQFKLNVLMTPEFLDRYLSKKMQNLKKNPFIVGQSLILMLGDDIPWYGNIVFVDTKSSNPKKGKPKRGRGYSNDNSPKILEIAVELHKWNRMPLPTTTDVRLLKILPLSVPVSRVFTAMSRISNPRFIDMILGKTPIRQIFFKNYLKFSRDTFNESQKVAVQSVMNNSITVLQGPPGTGKTSTIYEVILQLLENLNTYPILVVAASNIAIDNIAEKLLPKHGNSILRIVSMEKEPEYNREHHLASICLHHRVYDGMPANLQESIREMRRPNSKLSPTQYKKLLTSQISYSDKIIASSRVIFTTTVVAGGNQLKPLAKVPVVIMDEATQSSEPTTLIPLSMNGVEKFVFVGDQKQLSSFSQVPNLSLSLFERILSNGTYKTPHMLDTQYRMHPVISKFPREKFYDGLLKDGLTPDDRQMDGIPSNPVVFWDTRGKCPEGTVFSRFREDSGLTYANKGEVDYIQRVLIHLIHEKNIKKSSIGIITPYRGQRDLISSTLVKNDLVNPEKDEVHVEVDREDFYNESKPVTIHTVSDIMIASIDAFQGREKDFLIMSCVRSNKQNKIGFLSDARRMNVALTRAKYGLILIGDKSCLKNSDGLWKEYIESLEHAGSIKQTDDFKFD